MDQGPGGDAGPHVAAAVGAVGGLGGRRVQQRPGLRPGPDELGVVGAYSSGRNITSKWARWVTAKPT